MGLWETYDSRIDKLGGNKHDAAYRREERLYKRKIVDNQSYFEVEIDGHKQFVSIADSDNLNEKTMYSMPRETFKCGGLVHWMDNYWIINELDANSTLRRKGKLLQCNHLLKWVTSDGALHEQWCVVEDGTKYLTGELEDRNFVTTRGDSRIAVTISRNEYTSQFTRESRFLIDDPDSPIKLAYLLTKPLKVGLTYNDEGVYKFVLQEVTSTANDNQELGIADYYRYYPKEGHETVDPDFGDPGHVPTITEERKSWL